MLSQEGLSAQNVKGRSFGTTISGYAPECEQDARIGKVYAVYPASTNNIEFCVCFKEPCSVDSNRLQNTITVK